MEIQGGEKEVIIFTDNIFNEKLKLRISTKSSPKTKKTLKKLSKF